MLALRAELGGDPTWRETCWGGCGRRRWGAYAHQDLPFEWLVEELGVERSLAYAPVFQVVFALNKLFRPRRAGCCWSTWSWSRSEAAAASPGSTWTWCSPTRTVETA